MEPDFFHSRVITNFEPQYIYNFFMIVVVRVRPLTLKGTDTYIHLQPGCYSYNNVVHIDLLCFTLQCYTLLLYTYSEVIHVDKINDDKSFYLGC